MIPLVICVYFVASELKLKVLKDKNLFSFSMLEVIHVIFSNNAYCFVTEGQ